jgi:hypothetical protein
MPVSVTPAKGLIDSFEQDGEGKVDDETPLNINSSQMNFKSKDAVENFSALREARLQTTIAL